MPKAITKKQTLENNVSEKDEIVFSEHVVPTADEVKEEEIDDSLNEIYQDENGGMIDVSKMDTIRRHGFLYYLFIIIFIFGLIGGGAWAANKYYFSNINANADMIELVIDAPKEIIVGQEFSYKVDYKNLNNVEIKNIEIRLDYPENFIFLSSEPLAGQKNNLWQIASLPAHRSGEIEIKGKIIAPKNHIGVILADMSYVPVNFSSEFKKQASLETVIVDIGVDFIFNNQSSVMVNEGNTVSVKFKKGANNFMENLRLTVTGSDVFILATSSDLKNENIDMSKPGIWTVKKITDADQEIEVAFKFIGKKNPTEDVLFTAEYSDDGTIFYKFFENKITFEIIKNDLNLNLILNGSRNDQGINFGQTLNYSIVYANKGEGEMKDVVIMAVLNSGILDWSSLEDKNNGKIIGNTISWSKDEILGLETIATGAEATIDFSINVESMEKARPESGQIDPNRKYEIQSYAQFSIGNKEIKDTSDAKSNIIVSKVNSDLKLDEQVRYFNSDNIAVGSGPLPPKVGETTSFKVYWVLTNNLHELNNVKVEVILPPNVQWDNKNRTTVGTLNYDAAGHKVIWDVGRLPIDVYQVDAEFNISITPSESNKDTIIVLLPEASYSATDSVTSALISKTVKAKTTKLEDDDIANSDGRVIGN